MDSSAQFGTSQTPIDVSFFKNRYARTCETKRMRLEELRDLILNTSASAKNELPWLKLAKFGDKQSANSSLRHDKNILSVSGIEADYDGENLSFEDALGIIKSENLNALLYTSPSFTEAAPRWRILMPTSRALPPEVRAKLVARLNGLFNGIFAAESFVLSQCYFYGCVNANALHRVEIVDGDFIDRRSDLDQGAIGPRDNAGVDFATSPTSNQPINVEKRLEEMRFEGDSEKSIHNTQLSVSASLLRRRVHPEKVVSTILEATRKAAGSAGAQWDWVSEENKIRRMGDDWLRKHPEDAFRQSDFANEPLISTSHDFVSGFTPPDYLIEGLLQRRFLYSMTGPTGAGKTAIALTIALHVVSGRPIADREVERGKVLFLAGENPDDVRMRWLKICEENQIDVNHPAMFWRAGTLKLKSDDIRNKILAETAAHGPFALVIVDTSAAFFEGDDENSNTQLGDHARVLRSYVEVAGGPTILVTCHPVKNPDLENLLPRGGGSFIAEVDGNLVCKKQPDGHIVDLHWNGKFRGPDFPPIPFRLLPGTCSRLVDSKGREISTVTARQISDHERGAAESEVRKNQDELLHIMKQHPESSLRELAENLGWRYGNGLPDTSKVRRTMKALQGERLVEKKRGRYRLTKSGKDAPLQLDVRSSLTGARESPKFYSPPPSKSVSDETSA